VPSVGALFDEWSPARLERRPLGDEAWARILEAWAEVRKGATGTPAVALRLPGDERREGLESTIATAVRNDMETMAVEARRHWIRRGFRPRESRIGLMAFFVALLLAGAIDYKGSGDPIDVLLAQTLVVLAWVALWEPADRIFTAASFRLARRYFEELAPAEVRVSWD
jgi:hypothetical protein